MTALVPLNRFLQFAWLTCLQTVSHDLRPDRRAREVSCDSRNQPACNCNPRSASLQLPQIYSTGHINNTWSNLSCSWWVDVHNGRVLTNLERTVCVQSQTMMRIMRACSPKLARPWGLYSAQWPQSDQRCQGLLNSAVLSIHEHGHPGRVVWCVKVQRILIKEKHHTWLPPKASTDFVFSIWPQDSNSTTVTPSSRFGDKTS